MITIKNFSEADIQNKVDWINDDNNNKYLHYDLPLEYDKTLNWYKNKADNRFDGVILYNDIPVGLIGLLSIDNNVKKAEVYFMLGDDSFKGKGVATEALKLMIEKAFKDFNLNKLYAFTETENIAAQRLMEKTGFKKEGLHVDDILNKERQLVARYSYATFRGDFF